MPALRSILQDRRPQGDGRRTSIDATPGERIGELLEIATLALENEEGIANVGSGPLAPALHQELNALACELRAVADHCTDLAQQLGAIHQCIARRPAGPLPDDVRAFVESTPWTVAKTDATTWPHEYVVRTPENASMILALARHIVEHGVEGRFYSQVRKYHHEDGKVYWSMDDSPETTTLINRCDETATYEARFAAGTLPKAK